MILGSGLGVLLVVGLIMLTAGLFTGSPMPLPGWPATVHGEADIPGATPNPEPTNGSEQTSKPTLIPTAPTTTPAPGQTTPGNGNGNGQSHRPTKSPGKP